MGHGHMCWLKRALFVSHTNNHRHTVSLVPEKVWVTRAQSQRDPGPHPKAAGPMGLEVVDIILYRTWNYPRTHRKKPGIMRPRYNWPV